MNTRTMRRPHILGARAGFTLVELMAVMVILGILAFFLVPVLLTTEESAKIQTTRAELANLGSVCDECERDRGWYPPSKFKSEWGSPPNELNTGVECLVLALWSDNWEAGGRLDVEKLANTDGDRSAGPITDLPSSELFECVDAWGNPIAYIASADYGVDHRYVTFAADGSTVESVVRAAKSTKTGRYVGHGKFQLLSAGPDGEFGTEDDISHPKQ